MVAVPAHGAGDVQRQPVVEQEHGTDLVGDKFRRVIVTVVHERGDMAGIDIVRAELCRADGVGFQTNAEDLGLDARENLCLVIRDRQDLIHRLRVAAAGGEAVCRVILIAVGNPEVDDAGLAGFFGEILRNGHAALAVFDPEFADRLIRGRESQTVLDHGVGEERRVKVDAEAALFGIGDPAGKMLRLDGVAVGELATFKNSVACMQIQFLFARRQAQNFVKVRHQLLGRGSLAGIVASGLDAAGERLLRVKADDVVALPAVNGDGYVFQCFQYGLGIDTERGVAFFCKCISVHIRSSSVKKENLFHKRLRAGFRIHLHQHDVLHILVPAVHDRTFGLHAGGLGDAVALVIAEQLITDVPDRVVADAGLMQHVFHLRPDLVVAADIFRKLPRKNRRFPCVAFHLNPS